jgi:hypothetical protein
MGYQVMLDGRDAIDVCVDADVRQIFASLETSEGYFLGGHFLYFSPLVNVHFEFCALPFQTYSTLQYRVLRFISS